MFKRKSAVRKEQVYTDEQLRHMIAPPVLDHVARTVLGVNSSRDHLAQKLVALEGHPTPAEQSGRNPNSVPIIGAIGNSARSRAQIKAYREPPRER